MFLLLNKSSKFLTEFKHLKKNNYNLYKQTFCSSNFNDPFCNTSLNIREKIGRNLYKNIDHPIGIITQMIKNYFIDNKVIKSKHNYLINDKYNKSNEFKLFDSFSPIVSVKECFENLLVEPTHETLSPKNTYYINKDNVLRTHMTTHDVQLMKDGHKAIISVGDVYRRDTIDGTHYPVFHQLDGFKVFNTTNKQIVFEDLKFCLENLIKNVIGECKMRWVDAYFPFTEPSAELEIYYNNNWLEVLGCGVFRDKVLLNGGLNPEIQTVWAFGMGIERLAMTLFKIKDIRLFWSQDPRFLNQFKANTINEFKIYSKYPPCYKDFSFYINDNFEENDIHELIRDISGDIVEEVKLIDKYINKANKTSLCFRVNFRHMDKSLTNEEINIIQFKIRDRLKNTLGLELR